MGKVIEEVKISNFMKPKKSVILKAVVDTGATMLVLPENVIKQLGLKMIFEVPARYGNNTAAKKSIYAAVVLEIKGRSGTFGVLAKEPNSQPLIGQAVLSILDLVVDTKSGCLLPNPLSPDVPMMEIL